MAPERKNRAMTVRSNPGDMGPPKCDSSFLYTSERDGETAQAPGWAPGARPHQPSAKVAEQGVKPGFWARFVVSWSVPYMTASAWNVRSVTAERPGDR
ncbi:hypothetical protein D3C72_663190 [compost metagenome]